MESNSRMNKIMKGGFEINEVQSAQREFEGQIKLINSVVSAYGIMSKNKRAKVGLERMNIMDGTTAVDLMLGDPEIDKVKCPGCGLLVMRSECLDYSGASKFQECEGCEIGLETKERLLPIHT